MPDLAVRHLLQRELPKAYPLVRRAVRVSPERWSSFARGLAAERGGVLAVFADEALPLGVAAYREVGSLRHEHSLEVGLIVAFELSRLAPVRKALCGGLEALARERGCRSLTYTVAARGCSETNSAQRLSWEKLGLKMETVSFVRELAPAALA